MKDKVKKYLLDISNSINSIYEYLGEKRDFIEYKRNKLLRRAIEREFEIIGEAVNRILKEDKSVQMKNAGNIIGLRNFVIHSYDSVDDTIIWGIIINHLPKLKTEVEDLLES